MIYLDNAASTMPSKEVKQKLIDLLDNYGNPSSIHLIGIEARRVIEKATNIISSRISCNKDEIFYTSGATMGNQLIIQGFLKANPNGKVVISTIEHDDIMLLADSMPDKFYRVSVNGLGQIDLQELSDLLYSINEPTLFCIQYANSENGVIQDILSISSLIHKFENKYLHVDATQYIPHYPINVTKLNIDSMSMSGQKINCIKGIGMLYVKKDMPISPIIYGEQGLIGGTENVLGIGCLGEAFKNLKYNNTELSAKSDYLIKNLKGKLIGSINNRLPNNVYMLFDGINSESMVTLLNEVGICVSAGSACSSQIAKPSHVVLSMGYTEEEAKSCVRFTLNNDITYDDLDYVIKKTNEFIDLLKEDA